EWGQNKEKEIEDIPTRPDENLNNCQKSADMKYNKNSDNTKDGDIDKIGACKDDTKSVELANTDRNIAKIDESEAKKDGHEIFDGQGSGRRRKDSSELNNEPTKDEIEASGKKVVRRFPSEDVVHKIFRYLPTRWSCSHIFDPDALVELELKQRRNVNPGI
ncbi:30941_t:CDS:2, partial [Gigaspora margarita]